MGLSQILHNKKFDMIFSVLLGIGVICILRPICSGSDCSVNKPPSDVNFHEHVYRLGGKCYQFKIKNLTCPPSGAIEAFMSKLN